MADPVYQPPVDIIIPQGATWRQRYRYFYRDENGSKVGIDISDFTPQGQVRAKKAKDADLYAEMTFEADDASEGYVTAVLKASVTGTIPKSGYYDVELTGQGADPEVIRLAQGKATLDTEVTD